MQQTIQDLNQKIINLQLENEKSNDKLEESLEQSSQKDKKIEELETKLQENNE